MATSLVKLSTTCRRCGTASTLSVSRDSVRAYKKGALVQEAFPQVSPAERELFFVTGICGTCWDRMLAF